MKKVILLICSVILTFDCSPVPLGINYSDCVTNGEKRCPISDGMKWQDLLIETNKNFMSPSNERTKRRVMDYPSRNKIPFPDDMNSPYTFDKNYGNNPFEGIYEGLRNEDDGMLWNNNIDDGKIDDGIWFNSVEKPRYDLLGNKRVYKIEKIGKRIMARQHGDDWKSSDYKRYFYY